METENTNNFRIKVPLNFFVAENIRLLYHKYKDSENNHFTIDKIAEKYQVSEQTIRNILNRKTYKTMPKKFKPPDFSRNIKKDNLLQIKAIIQAEYEKKKDSLITFDSFYNIISNPIITFLGYMPSKEKMKRILKTMPKIKLK